MHFENKINKHLFYTISQDIDFVLATRKEASIYKNLCVVEEVADGHCLIYCIARQLYNDLSRYQDVRNAIADYELSNPDRYQAIAKDNDLDAHIAGLKADRESKTR